MTPARRSPTPDERKRDAERTRRALLDAALVEFSAKGRAGARVSEIARRAGVDKQLISYYFGGKDGLYSALAEEWLAAEREFARPELSLPDLVAAYVLDGSKYRDITRLLVRDAMEDNEDSPVAAVDETAPGEIEDLRRRQAEGEIAEDIDPAYLLLAVTGAASVGVILPGGVRQATGLEPDSEEFAERYAEQLRRIVRRLAEPPREG
jgi:TetR/AcrR family transcriptional regulator